APEGGGRDPASPAGGPDRDLQFPPGLGGRHAQAVPAADQPDAATPPAGLRLRVAPDRARSRPVRVRRRGARRRPDRLSGLGHGAPAGKPRAATGGGSSLPIHFMEPPSSLALGFDVAAEPLRWQTAQKARDSGSLTASAPFLLLEEAGKPGAQPVVGLYSPVY